MRTVDVRKGVLLRLRPEVLRAVDRARGDEGRTAWLTEVILRELDRLERPQGDQVERRGLMTRTAFSDDEISSEEPPSDYEYSQAIDANGGSGLDGEPPEMGDPAALSSLEGPDDSEFTSGDEL